MSIKKKLREYKVFPSKKLGQNFLIDKNILEKIINTAEIKKEDKILEIGAGIGNLTKELAKKAKKVTAVEKDKKMVEILKEELKNFKNVEIVEGDIRDLLKEISEKLKNYKIVANIPYYLTSRLLRKIFELKRKPKLIVLMVQKEVAQRIVAQPPKMNLLAISVQFFARVKIVHYVSRNCFFPRPKVDSAIIKILPQKPPLKEIDLFFKIVKAGFLHPRKKILKNFNKGLKLEKEKVKNWLNSCKIEEERRAESLGMKDWICLTKNFISLN
jgi:16S rRNA (adenine1518-N6/adenine1519-N6)-dimethyltransferase